MLTIKGEIPEYQLNNEAKNEIKKKKIKEIEKIANREKVIL